MKTARLDTIGNGTRLHEFYAYCSTWTVCGLMSPTKQGHGHVDMTASVRKRLCKRCILVREADERRMKTVRGSD